MTFFTAALKKQKRDLKDLNCTGNLIKNQTDSDLISNEHLTEGEDYQ